jgi:mannose-1-phosphate guanylyltransferase
MKCAMILAAGFGTRMRPLSNLRPKCLMPLMNRPLLGLWLERMAVWGMERVVVNTHYLAGLVSSFLEQNTSPGLEVIQSFEPEILGTGGGLVAARNKLGDEPFLLSNADVISSIEAPSLLERLKECGALAVVALADEPRFNTVAVQGENLLGFKGDAGLPKASRWLTYTGIAAISPRLLDYLPGSGESSLIQAFRLALADGQKVLGMRLPDYWDDLGAPKRLWSLHRDLVYNPPPGLEGLSPASPLVMGPGAKIAPDAKVGGFVVLGGGATIEPGARVNNSILLPHARVTGGVRVDDAILGDGFVAKTDITGGAHA